MPSAARARALEMRSDGFDARHHAWSAIGSPKPVVTSATMFFWKATSGAADMTRPGRRRNGSAAGGATPVTSAESSARSPGATRGSAPPDRMPMLDQMSGRVRPLM